MIISMWGHKQAQQPRVKGSMLLPLWELLSGAWEIRLLHREKFRSPAVVSSFSPSRVCTRRDPKAGTRCSGHPPLCWVETPYIHYTISQPESIT